MSDKGNKGYVIRCIDASNGSVIYRGNKDRCSDVRDALKLDETYTLKGARLALARLSRKKPEDFYSIEMLGCCYPFFDEKQTEPEERETDGQFKQRIMRRIEHSMKCLDELSSGNNFENMRISEVKYDLHDIREILQEVIL